MAGELLDLGLGHTLRFYGWAPDRRLNPQYADRPDIDRLGAIIDHPVGTFGGGDKDFMHSGSVLFDVPGADLFEGPRWTVEQWDPLTLSPSIQCKCGDHGYIRGGRWVLAL